MLIIQLLIVLALIAMLLEDLSDEAARDKSRRRAAHIQWLWHNKLITNFQYNRTKL